MKVWKWSLHQVPSAIHGNWLLQPSVGRSLPMVWFGSNDICTLTHLPQHFKKEKWEAQTWLDKKCWQIAKVCNNVQTNSSTISVCRPCHVLLCSFALAAGFGSLAYLSLVIKPRTIEFQYKIVEIKKAGMIYSWISLFFHYLVGDYFYLKDTQYKSGVVRYISNHQIPQKGIDHIVACKVVFSFDCSLVWIIPSKWCHAKQPIGG